ncbi:hypothetical protein DYB28_009892 [Aphanomyces astaci]|uniref:PX domain-containing protein n=3 Tax=Aphanomyces astaci TaxID=112090 RepID=A0A397CPD0_APHAT|nr:hypothetical protein DYB30_012171 [Aphanomyces astaci]RLO10047.1 hypothetical protein DYB28_009892 [Aphanomyces astaci]
MVATVTSMSLVTSSSLSTKPQLVSSNIASSTDSSTAPTLLHDAFRRSISAPTDRVPAQDRRFQRNIHHLRDSLDETSTNLHAAACFDINDDDDGWGWFEDIDDVHVVLPATSSTTNDLPSHEPLYASDIVPQHHILKSFPPLVDLLYEPPFASSGFEWLAHLSPRRPQAARLEIRSFRIVQDADGYDRHAEYCIQCWIGEASHSVWKRFAAFKRFAYTLKINGSRRTLRAWSDVLDRSSWFRSLDVSYLHQMCCLLETFAQVLLLEAQTPYLLARFLEAE